MPDGNGRLIYGIALLLFLILLNGVYAMSEIAVVSSRKARLQRLADDGSRGALSALVLHGEPSNFLSTIQVGIQSAYLTLNTLIYRHVCDAA